MELDGVSFPEAVELLAERARVALPKEWHAISGSDLAPELAAKRAAEQEKIATAYRLNRFASAFYHRQMKSTPSVLQYFVDRGVSDEMQRGFYTGYAPSGWDALARELAEKKAPLELAQELGLIRPSPKGLGPIDLFRGRAMFPILDMRGRVAGFGGRILPQEENAAGAPKYLNSPESILFKKSKLAFGLYQAQKDIRESDQVILVEGYFDVVAMHAAGFRQTVSPCGTAVGPELLAMLRRLGQKIIVIFDGDAAGIAATERTMETGLENGVVFYGVTLPEGMDPDQILIDAKTGQLKPEGVAQMQTWLDQAQPILDYRIQQEAQAAKGNAELKSQALKKIATWLSKYTDPVGKSLRIETLAKQFEISSQIVSQAVGGYHQQAFVRDGTPTEVGMRGTGILPSRAPSGLSPSWRADTRMPTSFGGPPPRTNVVAKVRTTPSEQLLLGAIVSNPDLAEILRKAQNQLPRGKTLDELWTWDAARTWIKEIFLPTEAWAEWQANTREHLEKIQDPELKAVLNRALMTEFSENRKSEWKKALEWRIARIWARFSHEIKQELNRVESGKDSNLQEKLLQEYLDVQRKIDEFKSFYDEAER